MYSMAESKAFSITFKTIRTCLKAKKWRVRAEQLELERAGKVLCRRHFRTSMRGVSEAYRAESRVQDGMTRAAQPFNN